MGKGEPVCKVIPICPGDGEEREIRYFRLLESYGGKESALAVSLVYDGGEQSIDIGPARPKDLFRGQSGQPVLYCGEQSLPWGRGGGSQARFKCARSIGGTHLQRYEVGSWRMEPTGQSMCGEGEFYNIENAGLMGGYQ